MSNFIVGIINALIKAFGVVLSFIFNILPDSPFQVIDNSVISEYMATLNYFVPLSEMVAIGQAWLTAIGVFYIYQIILRWSKAIE